MSTRLFSLTGLLGFLALLVWSAPALGQPEPPAAKPPPARTPAAARSPALPGRNMSIELRAVAEESPAAGVNSWSAGESSTPDWHKLLLANGERAQFEWSDAQAWSWTSAAVRGNGVGSVDGVQHSLQWAQDVRTLECLVSWPGGGKPARVELFLQVGNSGLSATQGATPHPQRQQLRTVVWVPLGEWFTVARSGPRPAQLAPGSYSSRSAAGSEARLLQVRVLAPD